MGSRHVTLHRHLRPEQQPRSWAYRIVIEGKAISTDAATLKQARLDEIYDAAAQVTGATDIYVTTLKGSRKEGAPRTASVGSTRKRPPGRAVPKPVKRRGKGRAMASYFANARRYNWTARELHERLAAAGLLDRAIRRGFVTPLEDTTVPAVVAADTASTNGHLIVNRTEGPPNTVGERANLIQWYTDLVARDEHAMVRFSDGRRHAASLMLARLLGKVGATTRLSAKERSARSILGQAKLHGWTQQKLAERLQARGLLGTAKKAFAFEPPLGFNEAPAEQAAETALEPRSDTISGAAAPESTRPVIGAPEPIRAPARPAVPPGAVPVAQATATVTRLRHSQHPDVLVARPKPGVDRPDIPEWRWANIVRAWAHVDTDPAQLCQSNGISRPQLDHELERRGIDPYRATFTDKQAALEAVPPRRW